MGEWEGLSDPTTTTGVISRSGVAPQLEVHVPVPHPLNQLQPPETGPQPVVREHTPPPTSLDQAVANAVRSAMTQQFTLNADQQRALHAGKSQDVEDAKENGRKRMIGWVLGALGALGLTGGGGTYYVQSRDPAPQEEPTSVAERTSVLEHNAEDLREDVTEVQKKTTEIDKALDEHVKDQGKENTAAKLRGVRQEMMLEQLLRVEGKRPPTKTPVYNEAQKAVGLGGD
jgi:hypothetical protein